MLQAAGARGGLVGVDRTGAGAGNGVVIVGDAGEQYRVIEHGGPFRAYLQGRAGVGHPVDRDHRPGLPQDVGLGVEVLPGGAAHHAIGCQARRPLEGAHRRLGGRPEIAVDVHRGQAGIVGVHQVEVILQLPHGPAGRAPPQYAGELTGAQALGQQVVGDVGVHLPELVPGGAAHHAVGRQPEVPLESLDGPFGGRAELAVHRGVVQGSVDGAGNLEPELDQTDVLSLVALAQRCAGVGVGGAVVRLDAEELGVNGVPGGFAHHAVHGEAVPALEGADRRRRPAAEAAVHRHRGDGGHILADGVEPELQLFHRAPAGAGAQDGAAPGAVRQDAGGGLALAGQLGQVLDRDVDIADLIPGLAADHAVGGQAELPLEPLDCFGHLLAENAVRRQGAEEGIVLGNAVELALEGKNAGPAVAPAHRAAGIALGDGGDVGGADDLDVIAVVVAQDGQGAAALLGQSDGPPLFEARAGHRFAIAVLGKVGVDGAGLADEGAENVVGEPDHHVKDGAPVDVSLVVPGRTGDVEIVPAGRIPLGIDAVERQRDLTVDVGPQGLLGPGNTE